ncbi:hypothetical protein D623_10024884 [Myotis brandtii]|uniref:Uncharacterized protein n=1 Tax=Myotis brandtii TaxID=109478 RepID=S7Q5I3_MYOBR|nr:hypothetical protein D623_10024884 [Myotis brandtii]
MQLALPKNEASRGNLVRKLSPPANGTKCDSHHSHFCSGTSYTTHAAALIQAREWDPDASPDIRLGDSASPALRRGPADPQPEFPHV